MKTNQNLTRQMGNSPYHGREGDGMFNATELLEQWNAPIGARRGNKKAHIRG